MSIGFFDSGVGGITVLEMALERLPKESFLFYADVDNVPYGQKTPDEIINYTDYAVNFLIEHGADIIVLACNTATSAAAKFLRAKYSQPIIGMEPAVKVALKDRHDDCDRILVTATELTLKLEKLDYLIHTLGITDKVDFLSLQGLVNFAENRVFEENYVKPYLINQFSKIDFSNITSLVLGCTHFTYFKSLIYKTIQETYQKDIHIIDGNYGTISHLMHVINDKEVVLKRYKEPLQFFESGRPKSSNDIDLLLKIAHRENQGG